MIPHERALVERYTDRPFAIFGVNTDSAQAYEQGMREEPVTWRSVMEGSTSGPVASRWGVTGYPTLYLLDHEGRIVAIDGNLRNEQWLDEKLEALVAEAEAEAEAARSGGDAAGGSQE